MTFAFRLEGLPGRWSLSANVRPSLKRLNHRLICVAIADRLLNLLDHFRFGISKLVAKLDAVPMFHAFSHYWSKCNETSTYYSTSHTSRLGEKDALGEATENHACARRSPTTVIRFAILPSSLAFPGKNEVKYFLKRVEDVEICFCLNTQVSMVLRSCKCC
jgi:hypothetical protein